MALQSNRLASLCMIRIKEVQNVEAAIFGLACLHASQNATQWCTNDFVQNGHVAAVSQSLGCELQLLTVPDTGQTFGRIA